MKPEITLILSALPWLKLFGSAGLKLSSVRPSKPAPKTMFAFAQEPRSMEEVEPVVEVAGGAAAAAEEAAGGAATTEDAAGGAAATVHAEAEPVSEPVPEEAEPVDELDAGGVVALPVDVLAAVPPIAAVISSAVTSGTRRFCVKTQPTGSFASSPARISAAKTGDESSASKV